MRIFSRRQFLVNSVAVVSAFAQLKDSAFAKSAKKHGVAVSGPHIVAKEYWPPAIPADFVGAFDNGLCCLVNEFGRLSLTDWQKTVSGKDVPVLAELSGIGKKVIDLCVMPKRALALVDQSSDGDQKLALIVINLSTPLAPSVMATLPLDRLSEAISVTAWQDLACVAGISPKGESIVVIYNLGKGKTIDGSCLGELALPERASKIDLQNRLLVALTGNEKSQLVVANLTNPQTPTIKATIDLNGTYSCFARAKDLVVTAGESGQDKYDAQLITLRPSPRIVSSTALSEFKAITAMVGQGNLFMLLAETAQGRSLIPLSAVKSLSLFSRPEIKIADNIGPNQGFGRLSANNKTVFVASGWSGVQSFSITKSGLAPGPSYTIPRLPASGVATWGNFACVAGSDIILYDIQEPAKPVLVKTAPLTATLKSVVGAGSYILCLGKDSITLRKIDKPDAIAASFPTTGKQMSFDPVNHTAFILRDEKKKTTVQELKVYSNRLMPTATFDLDGGAARISASGGYLMVGSLNDIRLYSIGKTLELVGAHHFPNLALRDFVFGNEYMYATAVDPKSQGFLLVLAKDKDAKGELNVLGSVDLPHDGAALACSDKAVIAVGRTFEGKDLSAIVDVSNPAQPKIKSTLPALESASAVVVKDDLAIVAGRGLEIVSVS